MSEKVVFFTDNTGYGGAEGMLLILLAGLDRGRWQPVLFHLDVPGILPLVEKARALDIPTASAPEMRGHHDWRWVLRFSRILRGERPAIFHANRVGPLDGAYATAAAVLARVPAVVATQHLFVEEQALKTAGRQRLVSLAVDRYIAVSNHVAHGLRRFVLSPKKVRVIHNGIPLDSFLRTRRPAPPHLGSKGKPVLLTLARLHAQKGLGYLIEAAALLPDATFAIAGEGPDRAALEAQARALGLADRVIFLGQRQDVRELLAGCDAFVLPSLWEGLPVSILEAMAAGKPVIASEIPGNDEAVVHGITGLLVPPRDPVALADAIRSVVADPALAARLGTAGRERAEQEFSVDTMVRRTTAIYDEILSTRWAPQALEDGLSSRIEPAPLLPPRPGGISREAK